MATAATRIKVKRKRKTRSAFCEERVRLQQARAGSAYEYIVQQACIHTLGLSCPEEVVIEHERLEFLKDKWRRANAAYRNHSDTHRCGR